MELEKSMLDKLSTPERQKLNRQVRQKQVERYLEFVKTEREKHGSIKKANKANRKRTNVKFGDELLMQDAVQNFDDREVSRLLQKGVNCVFTIGNNTSLLHKCVGEDNLSTAELLIRQGVDVNCVDDDWWTPLHLACSTDLPEMVQLLLNNGANPTMLDVDGFFPSDLAPEGSETQQIILRHMENNGLNDEEKKTIQLKRPRQMFNDVQESLNAGVSPSLPSDDGVTLLHITSANGYKKVLRLLLKRNANVDSQDDLGWTPLHVAARFNQMEIIKYLLKNKADPNLTDRQGSKASAVTNSNEIRAVLLKAERKRSAAWRDSQLTTLEDPEDEYEEIADEPVTLVRINSKTVRTKHTTIAHEDGVAEARSRQEFVTQGVDSEFPPPPPPLKEKDDDGYEEIYVSKIWRATDAEQAVLPAVSSTDNLTDLAEITEEVILKEIQQRYAQGQIYTYIGDVLIAVNPFQDIPLYAKSISKKYHNEREVLPPHIYGVAERAYRCLINDHASQCCVISGESGAGKTETSKFLVQHLSRIAGSDESNLNSKINQVNPVLEAFGNARTVINSNSSRFAKFIELQINDLGKIMGAKLSEYLLEKSRVVYQSEGENNYHIFYWMFSGLTPEEFRFLQLQSISNHRYLRNRGVDLKNLTNSENREKFLELKECLKFIGFTQDDIENVLQLLAVVLHLGDITFTTGGNNDMATITNSDKVEQVSDMLKVSAEELGSSLVCEYTVTRGEQIKKERTLQQATDCRDALAKAIYSRLFSWIVNGVNQMIQPIVQSENPLHVGILDIFGFENFSRNSFEQVCINLANEQMQNFTNEHIFHKEQQDCMEEGVPLIDLHYQSNQAILDAFFERHTGVLAIMDEESTFPKATDASMATKLHQGPGKKYKTVYKMPKDGGTTFTIVHYAGAVLYDCKGFLDKNRDTLPNAVMYIVKTSDSLLIKDLFQSRVTRTGSLAPSARQQRSRKNTSKSPFEFFKKMKGGKPDKKSKARSPAMSVERKGPATMAYHFKNSLNDLMAKIQSARPHIVRCIRPNTTRKPMLFTPQYALAQLRYTGIAETIKIKKFGYAMRIKFRDFLARYVILSTGMLPSYSMVPDQQKCLQVLELCHLTPAKDNFKVGKTKIFLHDKHVEHLQATSDTVLKKIALSQAVCRGFMARKKYKKLLLQAQSRQQMELSTFVHQMSLHQDQLLSWLQDTQVQDSNRFMQSQKAREVNEICKSLDALDTLLDEYDQISPYKLPQKESQGLDDEYDDVALIYKPNKKNPEQSEEADKNESVFEETADDMNGHVQYRGLPAPPHGDYICDATSPPPCPREMYSQAGIYDVIPANQTVEYGNTRKSGPPAVPKRSPSTRLSTGSRTSSSSSGIYEDALTLDDGHHGSQHPGRHSPQHPGHYTHQQHQAVPMSPGHYPSPVPPLSPGHQQALSPKLQKKMAVNPASPSHQNASKPFSYITNLPGSPKQPRRSSEVKYDVPDVSPVDPTYEPIGGPIHYSQIHKQNGHGMPTSPGHHPVQVHPHQYQQGYPEYQQGQQGHYQLTMGQGHQYAHNQGHHHGHTPPMQQQYHPAHRTASPPIPKVGPQSPKTQRQTSITRKEENIRVTSPVLPKKTGDMSRTSDIVGANIDTVPKSDTRPPGHGPPSFPAPPPPLPVAARFVAATMENNRPPSPPLPPPPPEMISDPHSKPVPPPLVPSPPVPPKLAAEPPPPPPPISKIPGRPAVSSFEIGKKQIREEDPTRKSGAYPVSPAQQQQQNKNLVQELGKVKLRAAGQPGADGTRVESASPAGQENWGVPQPGQIKLTPVKPKEKPVRSSAEREIESGPTFVAKLRPTGAKPWEKDVSPSQPTMGMPGDDDLPPPPPPLADEDYLPPPPPPQEINLPRTPDSAGQRLYKKDVSPDPDRKPDSGIGSNSSLSSMEIDLDEIDFSQIPGYIPITSAVPNWKRDMIEKKNREKLEEYVSDMRRRKAEEDKWKNVPEWKRKLMQEKEQLKREQEMAKEMEAQEQKKREENAKIPAVLRRHQNILNQTEDAPPVTQPPVTQKVVTEPPKPVTTPQKVTEPLKPIVTQQTEEQTINSSRMEGMPKTTSVVSPDRSTNCQKEADAKKREEKARQMEREKELEEEEATMPAWKREIMMKRGTAPKNWGDEREEENQDVQ